MKTFLLTVALCAAAVCAAPKNKRDVSHLFQNQGNGQGYLPPNREHNHVPSLYAEPTQPSNQYLGPARQPLQLPATTYGVPFKAGSAPAPVQVADSAPVQIAAPAPVARAPVTSYGTPVVQQPAPAPAPSHRAPVGVPHVVYGPPAAQPQQRQQYVQSAPQTHYVPQPPQQYVPQPPQQYVPQPPQQYVPQPPQQQYVPQPPQQQYVPQVPQQRYVPSAPVHNGQQSQERLVFDAPIPSVSLSENHSVERIPSAQVEHDSISIEAVGKSSSGNQQQIGSNGGYVY